MLFRLLLANIWLVLISCTATVPPAPNVESAAHEYSALEEKELVYKDWTYPSIHDAAPINLRSSLQGKKLVLVVYFAPWCSNWRNELPVVNRLLERYQAFGFDVIGVSEYGSISDTKACVGDPPPFVVVKESDSREDREQTLHHGYRQATGDTRKWGSPWNIFIEPSKVSKHGDVLLTKAWIVNGEIIESEADAFIRRRLGLE